jgi:hypothetical protein
MSLKTIIAAWNSFWFKSESAHAMGLARVCYGLLVMQFCWLIAPNVMPFFGHNAIVSFETAQKYTNVPCINLILSERLDDTSIWMLFGLLCISAFTMALGLFSRTSAFVVFVLLCSFEHRNLFVLNGGDVLMRIMSFYLMLSPAGHAYSLDNVIKRKRGIEPPRQFPAWPQRLLALQVCLIYAHCFWTKIVGTPWLDGTALYWVLREREFSRLPMDWIANNLLLCKLLTWGTLVIEGSLCSLVWIKEFRYWILAGGYALHMGIDYAMNLPIFEGLMITCLLSFADPKDVEYCVDFVKGKVLAAANKLTAKDKVEIVKPIWSPARELTSARG